MTQHMSDQQDGVTSLRERQYRLTRTTILDALTELLAENRVDFSVQDVADRAGVSHRTVYRHFESREALIDGLVDEVQQKLAELVRTPLRPEDVPSIVRETYQMLDRLSPAVPTLIAMGVSGDRPSELGQQRTRDFLRVFKEVTAHLEPSDAKAVAWTLRHLASNQTLARLRRDGGIDSRSAGRAVSWAIEVLLEALRKGEGPELDEERET